VTWTPPSPIIARGKPSAQKKFSSAWVCKKCIACYSSAVEKTAGKNPALECYPPAKTIHALSEEPALPGKHLDQELYRLRDAEYRIVYAIFDEDASFISQS